MYVTAKEFDAICAAIDFVESNADGADDDKYPHDILNGLRSLFDKAKKDRSEKHFKYLVKKAVIKLRATKTK